MDVFVSFLFVAAGCGGAAGLLGFLAARYTRRVELETLHRVRRRRADLRFYRRYPRLLAARGRGRLRIDGR